jgi:hypothetical protein
MVNEEPQSVKSVEMRIVEEIGNLSGALWRIKTRSKALDEARESLLKLSMLIGQALDIKW